MLISSTRTIIINLTSVPVFGAYEMYLFKGYNLDSPVDYAKYGSTLINYNGTSTGNYYLLVIRNTYDDWAPIMLTDPYQISFSGTATY